MQRVQKYCRELVKVYNTEDVNSPKAAAYRKKIFTILRAAEAESDGCPQAVELFWRTAYYDPISEIRGRQDPNFLEYMVNIFTGEVMSHMMQPSRNVAIYYIILGDLFRYIQSPLSSVHYKKAVEANPELGKPFNQLALNENGIKAVRLFLLATSAKSPFRGASENLKKALDELKTGSDLLTTSKKIIQFMLLDFNRSDLLSQMSLLLSEFEENGDDSDDDLLPFVIHSIIIAHKHSSECFGDDYFLSPIQMLTEVFHTLLRSFRGLDESEESIAGGKRRRQLSESEDSDEEQSLDESDDVIRTTTSSVPVLWPISLCCEWLMAVEEHLAKINKDVTPVPASLLESLSSLTDKLIDRLNEFLRVLPLGNEDNSSEETNWLLNGPAGAQEEKKETALRQLAFWAENIASSPHSDIESTTYFRRKKTVAHSSLQKKMGILHITKEIRKQGENCWLPIFVILDYNVFEKHLGVLRSLVAANVVISVVPSFVLAELDKMKSTGPSIRDAMRFIEKQQTKGELRVVKAETHKECCETLVQSTDTAKINGPLVSLLVNDLDKYTGLTMPGLSIYHIDAFWDRFRKTERKTTVS